MNFAILVIAGLLGVVAHWYNRYAQGRTQSTFVEYLKCYKANTVSSLISNFAATSATFAASPPELSLQVVLLAFTSGYAIDSVMNKDKRPETISVETKETIKKVIKDDQASSIDSILDDDSKL